MSEPELSSWPTKAEAAAQLKISVRSLNRRINEGAIETQLRISAKPGRPAEPVCNPADISKLMPTAFVVPARPPAQPASSQELVSRTAPPPLDALAAWILPALGNLSQQPPAPPPPEPTIWIQLDEAERISGLSQNLLKKACSAGLITAVRDKRKWKIHRKELLNGSDSIAALQKN